MLQEWLVLFPRDGSTAALAVALLGFVIGLGLWIAGARYSRMLVTLVAVAIGGITGMLAPRLLHWDVNSSTAVLALAMACGALGFVFTRAGVGLGLIVILCLWASIGTWELRNEGVRLVLPTDCDNARDYCGALWTGLPDGVKYCIPFALGAGAIVAVALTILWPRVATAILFSLTGVTLMLSAGLSVLAMRNMSWPEFLPAHAQMQAMLLSGLVALGALVQGLPMNRRRPAPAAANPQAG